MWTFAQAGLVAGLLRFIWKKCRYLLFPSCRVVLFSCLCHDRKVKTTTGAEDTAILVLIGVENSLSFQTFEKKSCQVFVPVWSIILWFVPVSFWLVDRTQNCLYDPVWFLMLAKEKLKALIWQWKYDKKPSRNIFLKRCKRLLKTTFFLLSSCNIGHCLLYIPFEFEKTTLISQIWNSRQSFALLGVSIDFDISIFVWV